MAKYKRDVTEFVLDSVDIVEVIGRAVPLKKAGRNHKGLCPFHNEKTPSFVVSAEKQFFHCFGCGKSGNAIGFVMDHENMPFLDALESLAERQGLDLSPFLEDERSLNTYRNTTELYDVMRTIARQYYQLLRTHQPALDYIVKRQLSEAVAKRFGLGYAPDAWDFVLQYAKRHQISQEQLKDCGLVVKNDQARYYDRFRNRLMFPIIDIRGRVVGFGGRVLDDSLPKYLNSPESVIFHKSKVLYGLNYAKMSKNKRKQVILVEGYMDVIALHQYGYDNAVASLGTALTEHHVKILSRIYDEVIFAYDGDRAGRTAIMNSLAEFRPYDLTVKIVDMGDYKDPDELLKARGVDYFNEKINQATNTIAFAIQHIEKGYNLTSPDGRLAFMQATFTHIEQIDSMSERQYYLQQMADRLTLEPTAVVNDYKRWRKDHKDKSVEAPVNVLLDTDQVAPQVVASDSADDESQLYRIEGIIFGQVLSKNTAVNALVDDKKPFYYQVFNDILSQLPSYFNEHDQFRIKQAIDFLTLDQLDAIKHLPVEARQRLDEKAVNKLWQSRELLVLIAARDELDRDIDRLRIMTGSDSAVKQRELLVKREVLQKKIVALSKHSR